MLLEEEKNKTEDRRDEDILASSVEDPAQFSIIVERYEEAFLRKARTILGNREEVFDVVQEAFTKIYLNAERFKPVVGATFKSWAYKILLNVTFTWYGKLKKDRDGIAVFDTEFEEFIPDKATSAVYEKEAIRDYVISVLVRMPDSFSRALKEYFLVGKSQKEIANEEGVSVETIKTRICRAKKEFRKIECEMNNKI